MQPSETPDLSWIPPYLDRIRSYVSVRLSDNILIRMPNECFKLNPSGARLLNFLLQGGSLERVLAERSGDREAPAQINDFFIALMLMLGHRMCERFQSGAVEKVAYALGYIELPVLAELAVTDQCNIRCRFCYGSCRCGVQAGSRDGNRPSELDTRGFKRIIDIIRDDAEVPSMSFTGGEPTLRDDLPALIRYAARKKTMRVNLISNGTLITPSLARTLRRAGLASAQISIESPDPAIHDALTRVPGSHARSVAGVRALQQEGIHVHFHATTCTENAASLANMPAFAATLGIDRFSLNMLIPVGRGQDDELAVRYREMPGILEPIIRSAAAEGVTFMWYAPTPLCIFNPVARQLGNKSCAACDGLLAIDPRGNVLPCSSWNETVGSLLESDFESIWFGARATWLRGKKAAPTECDGCTDFAVCQGACPLYFDAFPQDRNDLICRKAACMTEENNGVHFHTSGISTP